MKIFDFYRKMKLSQKLLIVMLAVPIVLSLSMLFLSAKQVIESKNEPNQVLAESTAQEVIDKVDRNFYERSGDVQAFAINYYALKAVTASDSEDIDIEIQSFINLLMSYYVVYDVMMICDINGNVVAINTIDGNGKGISTDYLIGSKVSEQDWFKECSRGTGPTGGVWYSDFYKDVALGKMINSNGYGISFAAPIRDKSNNIVGVWYNRASWAKITQGIREEVEETLHQTEPEAMIIITDKSGRIIDAAKNDLILKENVSKDKFLLGESIVLGNKTINKNNYIVGWADSKGAYTYSGNEWRALTIFPKSKLNFYTFFSKDLAGLIIFISLMLLLAILTSSFYAKFIFTKIKEVKEKIILLTKGTFPEPIRVENSDEIGEIADSFNIMVNSLKVSQKFAEELGNGKLDAEFNLTDKDVLAQTLLIMQDSLKKAEKEDLDRKVDEEKRIWATQGLAKFSEILRNNANDREVLADNIIAEMVKYTDSNQGALYVINDDETNHLFLEMIACYAWNKKKHYVDKKIEFGEDLVGQCVLDKATIKLTEVPKEYIQISSGLGFDNPKAIIVVPLILNEHVFGVIELASFNKYEQHVIDFVEKIGESIASTFQSVKITSKTSFLLEQSQMQAEEMKAQEEEMRQNMEELHATQEQMNKAAREQQDEIERLEKINKDKISQMELLKKEIEESKNQTESLKRKLNEVHQQLADLAHENEQLKKSNS